MDKNRLKKDVIDSFDALSAFSERKWSHNNHYYTRMIKSAPENARILDIGCGAGNFLELAVSLGHGGTGIDFSPDMVKTAEKKFFGSSDAVKIICGDAYDIIPSLGSGEFDCAFSSAAMHHMDYIKLIPLLMPKLKKNGFFMSLDLYAAKTAADFLVCAAAAPMSAIASKIRNGRFGPHPQELTLWNEHAKLDTYLTLNELKMQMNRLGVRFRLNRLLYFRYLLTIWQNSPE